MRINELFEELKKIDLVEREAFDRGQGLDSLLEEFVYDVPSLPDEAKITRTRLISDYYSRVYNQSGRIDLAYQQTRKWAIQTYVQHHLQKRRDELKLNMRESVLFEKLDKNKLGKCYQLSGRFVMDHPDWDLVHGTITKQDGSGYTINHAWVERTEKIDGYTLRMVYDPVWDEKFPWDAYEKILGAKEIKRYTSGELAHECAKHLNWGPWESVNEDSQEDKERYFEERTNRHIRLVKEAARKIVERYPELKELTQEVADHDASKLKEPERTPYIAITWRHKLENEQGGFDPLKGKGYQTPGQLTKDDENQATLHHITTNSHHPEYWNKAKANVSAECRDKSIECIDTSKMPDLQVAHMTADWQAMSEELKKNSTREWFNQQKNVRWSFSPHQEELIDKLIKVFEDVDEHKLPYPENPQTLGMEIRKARLDKNMSGDSLAKALGVDRTYIVHIENGQLTPSALTLRRMCKILGVPEVYVKHIHYKYFSPTESILESAIDFPREELPKEIWDLKDGKYSLKPKIKEEVLKYIKSYSSRDLLSIAKEIHICGSLATNLWTQYSDFDVHIVVDKSKVTKNQKDLVKEVDDWVEENPKEVEGHPIQIYMQMSESQDYVGDSLWDLQKEFWGKGPKISKLNFNPYQYYKDIMEEVEKKAKECDIKLGELNRSVIDYASVKAAYEQMPKDGKKSLKELMQKKLGEIESDIKILSSYKKEWVKSRRRSSQPTSIQQAVTDKRMQKDWQKANAVFKFLAKFDYLLTIKALEGILEEDEILDDKDVTAITKVLKVDTDFEKKTVSPDQKQGAEK